MAKRTDTIIAATSIRNKTSLELRSILILLAASSEASTILLEGVSLIRSPIALAAMRRLIHRKRNAETAATPNITHLIESSVQKIPE
jgi:hypothetical protein